MSIKTLDVTLVRGGHGLLGLNHFQIIRNPGAEAILRLDKRLLCQIHRAAGYLDLLRYPRNRRDEFALSAPTPVACNGAYPAR